MPCAHEFDGEYLSRSDVAVMEVDGVGDAFRVVAALPCPDCDQPLRVELSVENRTEADLDFPLDDAEAALD